MEQESVFIANKGQFVSQTADKKLITTSCTIGNPLLSLDVRVPICDILKAHELGRLYIDTNSKTQSLQISGLHQTESFSDDCIYSLSILMALNCSQAAFFHTSA